jgi:5'-3' exoribonuclease 1
MGYNKIFFKKMGIPGLFGDYVTNNIPDCITKNIEYVVNSLSIDMNSLIHNCKGKVCQTYKSRKNFTDSELWSAIFKAITDNIEDLISRLAPKILFLATDGVAPMAKINQQRIRRHKAILNQEVDFFDSNLITPGTEFMFELDEYIQNFIKHYKKKTVSIYYSSVKVKGEGEHKIFDFYRTLDSKDNEAEFIYGNDADFLLISMFTEKNVVIYRESNYGTDLVDINIFKQEIAKIIHKDNPYENFLILLNFIGNDFLPKMFCYEGVRSSIEYLVDKFNQSDVKTLYANNEIHYDNYAKFVDELSDDEISLIEEKGDKLSQHVIKDAGSGDFLSSYCNYYFLKGKADFLIKNDYINDSTLSDIIQEKLKLMCVKYVKMVNWVLNYYKNGRLNINEDCFYPFNFAPLLYNLKNFERDDDIRKFHQTGSDEMTMLDQLVSVIPLGSCKILPKEVTKLTMTNSLIAHMYVESFSEETEGLKSFHYIPMVPIANKNLVKHAIKSLKLNADFLDKYKCINEIYKIDATEHKISAPKKMNFKLPQQQEVKISIPQFKSTFKQDYSKIGQNRNNVKIPVKVNITSSNVEIPQESASVEKITSPTKIVFGANKKNYFI